VIFHSIFLRKDCRLPDGFRVAQERFNNGWMLAGDLSTAGLDWALRRAGWNFVWVGKASTRFGYGRTDSAALARATNRALDQIGPRFNAAEVDSVKMSGYPGFRIARVTAHARHILEQNSPRAVDPASIRQIFV
jgi:hypothetical protein